MPSASVSTLPEFREWSIAAVRLLQGVVYLDDERCWDLVLRYESSLGGYFARLGLLLIVDEPEGLAYVRQLQEDECPDGYEQLPKLIRRSRLGYDTTVLCVLLRDELRRFEEEDVHNERCVVEADELFEQWKVFFPMEHDEVRQRRDFSTAVRKLADLGFVRRFGEEPEAWEIRRIVKARLPVAELEILRDQLLAEATRRKAPIESSGDSDG